MILSKFFIFLLHLRTPPPPISLLFFSYVLRCTPSLHNYEMLLIFKENNFSSVSTTT